MTTATTPETAAAMFTASGAPVGDELGPSKIVHLYDPATGMRGIVAVDNTACGPSIGGVRMAVDVTAEEVFRLARAMTLKNAAAGLPHGGGKAGIVADTHAADKERLVRAFGRAIRDLVEYIPGPDMGTDEVCMGWLLDEIGRAVGLPRVLGGIPLDELGATGYGLAQCAEVAAPLCGLKLDGAAVVVEGFGNVGRHAARCLEEKGAKLIGASDSRGAVYVSNGIPVEELAAIKQESGSVVACGKGQRLSHADLLILACDVLVPAARPDSIHADNARAIQARLILQGANIPATPRAETILHERGVVSVPDFIANAGGVICASVEYHGGSETDAFARIAEKIRRNTAEVLEHSRRDAVEPRQAAVALARRRVLEAMSFRVAS